MSDRSKTARDRPVVDTVRRGEHVERADRGHRADRADRADRAKMISVRLTTEEFEALSAQATELGIGPSTLARTLIRRGLSEQTPAPSALGNRREADPQATRQPDLVARVEALERWVAGHSRTH